MRFLRPSDAASEPALDGAAEPLSPPLDVAGERFSPAPELERHLFRRSLDRLSEDCARCGDCGRTPLIGEDVHLYEDGAIVCELCRQLRREMPVSTDRVLAVLAPASPALRVRRVERAPERPVAAD